MVEITDNIEGKEISKLTVVGNEIWIDFKDNSTLHIETAPDTPTSIFYNRSKNDCLEKAQILWTNLSNNDDDFTIIDRGESYEKMVKQYPKGEKY